MSLIKLQQMIDGGKTFYYRDQPAVIKSFESRTAGFEILVEIYGRPQIFIKESEEKITLFLANFKELPVVTEAEEVNSQVPANNQPKTIYVPEIYNETKGLFKSLSEKLLEDIDKVRTDPGYVNQAKQVCNNVGAIVNLTRLQMQLLQKG